MTTKELLQREIWSLMCYCMWDASTWFTFDELDKRKDRVMKMIDKLDYENKLWGELLWYINICRDIELIKEVQSDRDVFIPSMAWVYSLIHNWVVVYVWQCTNLINRLSQHKDKIYDSFSFLPIEDRKERNLAESSRIKMMQPKYNIGWK